MARGPIREKAHPPDGFVGRTVEEAKQWLRRVLREGEQAPCPVCTQNVKIYMRPMSNASARALIALYRDHGVEWGHLPTAVERHAPDIANQGGYTVLSAHWGLIEEERVKRPDGGRAGWWRVTPLGVEYLRGDVAVPKYARLYNSQCLGLEGPPRTIHDALGQRFNLADLMSNQ